MKYKRQFALQLLLRLALKVFEDWLPKQIEKNFGVSSGKDLFQQKLWGGATQ